MKKVKQLSPLDIEHDCGDDICNGGCPDCGECVYSTYGLGGGCIGLYQQCLNEKCGFGEVLPDAEMEDQ